MHQLVEWNWKDALAVCHRETRRLLGASPSAEDAAQEALLRAWRAQDRCRTPEAAGPWLRAIARREALRTTGGHVDVALDESLTAVDPAEMSVDDRLALREVVASFGDADRALMLGRYWFEMTHPQLARWVGMPEGTVKVRLHRMRQRMREELTHP